MQESPFPNSDITGLTQYTIKETIGTGSFGVVKLAIHNKTNVKVAIKILDKSKIPKKNKRIYNEINVLQSLNHPNICKIYEVIETPRTFYIVTEFISEGELFSYTQERTRLLQNDISKFFYQIINAVEYLHINNISHRDLKLENILIDSNNVIKLIDFGLATRIESGNNWLSTICGSLLYSPPEMWKEEKYNGILADIWSLGVILYVMSTGQLPFEDTNESELIRKIIKNKVSFPHFIPFLIKELLKNSLVKTPKDRWSWIKIKEHSLYKHGKVLFLRENNIYEEGLENSENIRIKHQVNEKLNMLINDKLNEIKEKNNSDQPCNWNIIQKILKDSVLKTYDWRRYLSHEDYTFSNNKERDNNGISNQIVPGRESLNLEDISKLTPSDIIKRIRRMNILNSFTESYKSANRPNSVVKNNKIKNEKDSKMGWNTTKITRKAARAITEFKEPYHLNLKSLNDNSGNLKLVEKDRKEKNVKLIPNSIISEGNSKHHSDIFIKTYSQHYIKKITSPTPIHKVINWNNNAIIRLNYNNNTSFNSNSINNSLSNLSYSSRTPQITQKIKPISLTKYKGKLPFRNALNYRFHNMGIPNFDEMNWSDFHKKNKSFTNINNITNTTAKSTNIDSKKKKTIGYIKWQSVVCNEKRAQQTSRNKSQKSTFHHTINTTQQNDSHCKDIWNEIKKPVKLVARTQRFQSSYKYSNINFNCYGNGANYTNKTNRNKELKHKNALHERVESKPKDNKNGKIKQLTIYLNSSLNVEKIVKERKTSKKGEENKKRLSVQKAEDNLKVAKVSIEWDGNSGKGNMTKTNKKIKRHSKIK